MKSWRLFLMVAIVVLLSLHLLLKNDQQISSQLFSNSYSPYHKRKQLSHVSTRNGSENFKSKDNNILSRSKDNFKSIDKYTLRGSKDRDILARLQDAIPNNNITQEMYERAFLWKGNTVKLRKIFRDAIVKKTPISMATIGGSVSAGGGIDQGSCEFPCLYMEILAQWMRTVFGVRVESRNTAMGGANSEYFSHCLNAHVSMETTDIVIGEFATNDRLSYTQSGFREMGRPLEELIRNTMKQQRENRPVLILADFVDKKILGPEFNSSHTCLFDLEQKHYKPLLEYYDITGVSLFNMVCPVYGEQPGFYSSDIISYDYFHPSHLSHHYIAIVLIKFFAGIIKEALNPLPLGLPNPYLPTPVLNSTWITNPVCFTNKRHEQIDSYSNLSVTELNGFHKYILRTSLRRFRKFEVMEYRKDLFDGFKGNKQGDWITLDLVAPSRPSGRVQQVLSLGYVNCEFCNETIISVWIGMREKPISPVFNFTTFKYSPGTIIIQVDDINLSDYVKEQQRFNVTIMLNGSYDFILHAAMIAWRYIK